MSSTIETTARILLVEDNVADAELVVDGLKNSAPGVSIHIAGDGVEALEYLRGLPESEPSPLPDLVLLDLNLPRQGGLETLDVLREDARLRLIPVIVLTTSKSQLEINRSYELGAAAVLNKPMRLTDQRAMVQALCDFWLGFVRLPQDGL